MRSQCSLALGRQKEEDGGVSADSVAGPVERFRDLSRHQRAVA
jgi:hypothetical protein